jgi:predicted ATPase
MTGRATSTSFVGREEELRRLQQGLESAAAGEPGALLVAGEAGIGKTRLVREFTDRIGGEAQVLLGSCIPLSGGGLPYGPIVDALRPLARDLDPAELDELLGPAQRHGRHSGWPSRSGSSPRFGCSSCSFASWTGSASGDRSCSS